MGREAYPPAADDALEIRLRRLALGVVENLPSDVDHAERVLHYSRELLRDFVCRRQGDDPCHGCEHDHRPRAARLTVVP